MGVMDLMDKAETAPWEKAIQEEMLEKWEMGLHLIELGIESGTIEKFLRVGRWQEVPLMGPEGPETSEESLLLVIDAEINPTDAPPS